MTSWKMMCWPLGPRWMKYEVKPMTMTALDHCRARRTSCRGRAMAVENIMVRVLCVGVDTMVVTGV